MTGVEVFCGIVAILLLLYYYLVAPYTFWKKQGVPGPEPIPLFGNTKEVFFGKKALGTYTLYVYEKFKNEPLVGIYINRTPALIVNDPDIIKTILIRDFAKFSDRPVSINEKAEPLSQHLFSLEPKRWRPLRTRLSPVFTTGKLKEMFSLILECSNGLEKYTDTLLARSNEIDCRELAARFTTDVIGSCAFGINMNSLSDEESDFRKAGQEFSSTSFTRILRFRLRDLAPRLYTLLGHVLPYTKATKFFLRVVPEMMEYRKKNNIVRKDFIDTLINLKDHPEMVGDIELTDALLAAQAFVFFIAGFETSSTTISNALYELAQNQDIQDKLREEIKDHEKENNGEWHYENIKAMPVLDCVFKETLRMYPPVTALVRKSVEDYTFEDSKVWIPKNTTVFIPSYGMHHDPNIFPNPEVFDIGRFKEEEESKRHPMHYIPFGDGPRNCIGARFAIYQTKVGLIKLLRNYKVEVCKQTVIPYQINERTILLAPKHPITLKVTKLES